MNKYIEMFMKDNDLKVDERFKIKDHDGEYWFNCDGTLLCCVSGNCNYEYVLLLNGVYKVEKLKKEPWKPTIGEYVWHVGDYGNIIRASYWGDKDEKYFIYHRLIFKTKEEAEDYKWFLDKVDEYKKPFSFNEDNYFFWCDSNEKIMDISSASYVQYQGTIFFGSRKNVENFIEKVGKDRIKKYMFGVYD